MHIIKLCKADDAIIVTLPASVVETFNLHENDDIAIEIVGDRIVLTRATPDFVDAWAAYQATEPRYRNAHQELGR